MMTQQTAELNTLLVTFTIESGKVNKLIEWKLKYVPKFKFKNKLAKKIKLPAN